MTRNKRREGYDLAVIGAGPAGMMAALRAAACGADVLLLEKNRTPGIKLSLTGKERCNITNAETEARAFAAAFGKNGRFLLSSLYYFGVGATLDFFHRNNVKTKIERGGRVFPESDSAKEVQSLFLRLLKEHRITLHAGRGVKGVTRRGDEIEKVIMDDSEIRAGSYIFSTGGLSYPQTGSTGDGYAWAKQLGHSVVKPQPALTPVEIKEKWVKRLEGLSLKNVRISVYQDKRKKTGRFGESLFTHTGMSGPIILDMSKEIGRLLPMGNISLLIDFKPALDFKILDKRILRDLDKNKNRSIRNILPALLPKRLIPVILERADINPDRAGHSVTKDERRRLLNLLKQFPLTVERLAGFDKAIITSGGIYLKEVDPCTMRSKIIKNLFFAGEILDLDGPTGGYNLQVCWSTGSLAGEKAVTG